MLILLLCSTASSSTSGTADMNDQLALEPQQLVAGETVLHRESRALLGWLSEAEGATTVLGRNPVPTDDMQSINDALRVCRTEVAKRPVYTVEDPILAESLPGLESVRARPDLHATFANLNWRPAMVDLERVLTFQKIVHTDGIDQRLKGVREKAKLLELCIPGQQPLPPLGAIADSDGKGFTISSNNPNLRIAGGQLSEAQVAQSPETPPVRMQAMTFLVYMGTSYLQVVRYRDRAFVRDGYHRAAGLLRRGITRVPCIFIEAQTFEEIAAPAGSLSYEVLYGDRPPRLSDFWNDAVAGSVKQVAIRKVVRVRGDEFVVPR
ncbi:MAG: hypothetical protein ACYDAY_06595 [Candidatus Dormibacteria bacterium]